MSDATAELDTLERPLTYEEERGKPMPSFNHGIIQMNLGGEFLRQRQFRVVSELTLELSDRSYVPDLSLYRREAANFQRDAIRRTDPPLLVVEIISPTQGYQEVLDKVAAYFEHGVKSCWLVWPPIQNITIMTPDGRQRSFTEGVVTDPVIGVTAEWAAVFS